MVPVQRFGLHEFADGNPCGAFLFFLIKLHE